MAHARGDRVRLMPALAQRLIEDKEKRNRGGLKCDWRERRGVVISISRVADSVTVLWDDRASFDQWPVRALQKV